MMTKTQDTRVFTSMMTANGGLLMSCCDLNKHKEVSCMHLFCMKCMGCKFKEEKENMQTVVFGQGVLFLFTFSNG